MKKHILINFIIIITVIFASSCKHTSKQNQMLDALEKSGVEVPAELREQTGFAWADVLFPIVIVVSLGLISFIAFRRFKNKTDEIGYSLGNMKSKMDSLTNDKDTYNKMSDKQKKELENLQKIFKNKSN